ncbi:hypothetical protein OF83DRAFT_1080710 [Amylostereum chailletii]|nr:hypothetical protein OF83DRAFT_1080710 [Amylostereum chailletii]
MSSSKNRKSRSLYGRDANRRVEQTLGTGYSGPSQPSSVYVIPASSSRRNYTEDGIVPAPATYVNRSQAIYPALSPVSPAYHPQYSTIPASSGYATISSSNRHYNSSFSPAYHSSHSRDIPTHSAHPRSAAISPGYRSSPIIQGQDKAASNRAVRHESDESNGFWAGDGQPPSWMVKNRHPLSFKVGDCVYVHTHRRIFSITSGSRNGTPPEKWTRPSIITALRVAEADGIPGGRVPTLAPLTSAQKAFELDPRSGTRQWVQGMHKHATDRIWWLPVRFVPAYPGDRGPNTPNDPEMARYSKRAPIEITWNNASERSRRPNASFIWVGDEGETVNDVQRINHMRWYSPHQPWIFMTDIQLEQHRFHGRIIDTIQKPNQWKVPTRSTGDRLSVTHPYHGWQGFR